MTTNAGLAGIPLMQGAAKSWPVVAGAGFGWSDFQFPWSLAVGFLKYSNQPISLTINDGVSQKTFENLYVLGVLPGPNSQIGRVRVVDRRWFWSRKHIERTYNKRRNVGVKRVADSSLPFDLQPVDKDVWYWDWTLRNQTTPWTAKEVLRDVLEEVCKAEEKFSGKKPTISLLISDSINQLPIQDLELADSGDNAVMRVLSYIPDAQLTLMPNGNIVVRDRSDVGREAEILNQMGNLEVWDRGHAEYVTFPMQMPSEVHVFFEYECEVEFMHLDSDTGVTWTADDRFMDNVIPQPEATLQVNGVARASGTYNTLEEYLAAIPVIPRVGRRITKQDLRRTVHIPFKDLWYFVGQSNGTWAPDPYWAARVEALTNNYRTLLRLNRRWVDRAKKIGMYRVATVNPEQGTRASAQAYIDHALVPTQRLDGILGQSGLPAPMAFNVEGYTSRIPAPFRPVLTDSDQGIIALEPIQDRAKRFEMPIPSKINTPVSANLHDVGVPMNVFGEGQKVCNVAFNMTVARGEYVELAAQHYARIILTMIPAGTNDARRLFKVVVKANDVRGSFPSGDAQTALSNAKGPIQELKIGQNIETARVPWVESRSRDIEQIFGIGAGDTPPNIEDLILNLGDGTTVKPADKAASLRAIAHERAARIFAKYMPRFMGSATGRFAPNAVPGGAADEVRHTVNNDGSVTTSVSFPEQVPERDFMAYFDANTRALVFRQPRKE